MSDLSASADQLGKWRGRKEEEKVGAGDPAKWDREGIS